MYRHLVLELNSSCNNNCIYCYIPKGISDESNCKKKVFLDAMRKYSEINNIEFTGGEPTLCPYLTGLVRVARERGITNRTLVTNGRRLSSLKYARNLISSGINRVVIPLDGHTSDIAESITRVPGSFNQVVAAARLIKSMNIELGLTIVVNAFNYRNIPEIVAKCVDLSADFINIQFLLPYVEDDQVLCRKIEEHVFVTYSESVPYVKKALDSVCNHKVNVHFIPFCYMQGYESFLISDADKTDRIVVNHKGYSYNMGAHVKKGSFKNEKCEACKWTKICHGFFLSYAAELGIEDQSDGFR